MEFNFDIGICLRKPISVFSHPDLPKSQIALERFIQIIDEMGIASAKAQGLRAPVTTFVRMRENPAHRVYIMKEDLKIERPSSSSSNGGATGSTLSNPHDARSQYDIPSRIASAGTASVGLSGIGELSGGSDVQNGKVVGMLKVGTKTLFVMDELGRQLRVTPQCILDFYVHESCQRRGHGKRLFEFMLMLENIQASNLAYDRPSHRLLQFLSKHYGLKEYVSQPNNFVIFKEYGLSSIELEPHRRISRAVLPETISNPVNTPAVPQAPTVTHRYHNQHRNRHRTRSHLSSAGRERHPERGQSDSKPGIEKELSFINEQEISSSGYEEISDGSATDGRWEQLQSQFQKARALEYTSNQSSASTETTKASLDVRTKYGKFISDIGTPAPFNTAPSTASMSRTVPLLPFVSPSPSSLSPIRAQLGGYSTTTGSTYAAAASAAAGSLRNVNLIRHGRRSGLTAAVGVGMKASGPGGQGSGTTAGSRRWVSVAGGR